MAELLAWCCVLECDEPADWDIYGPDGFEDSTQACTTHVGELLTDGVSVVQPIKADDDGA